MTTYYTAEPVLDLDLSINIQDPNTIAIMIHNA